ncbi:MAG: sporulation protein YtfJ [Clostridia bacterium]|nr:sporulation protein YtfJ [Clostridia bacterium]
MSNENIKKPTAAENLMQLMSFTADKALEMADAGSVLGEKTEIDGITIIPVSKVSAGFAGGGANIVNATVKKSNTPAGSGAKVTVTPLSFIVIKDGELKVVSVDASKNDTKSGIIAKVLEQVKSFAAKK